MSMNDLINFAAGPKGMLHFNGTDECPCNVSVMNNFPFPVNFKLEQFSPAQTKEQEGTTPMNNTYPERDYLNRRLSDVRTNHRIALQKQFHIHDHTGPHTYKELIDWVKNGKYTLDEKLTKIVDTNDEWRHEPFYGIVWTGRGFTNDFAGFEVAEEALQKAYTKAKDIINTQYPEHGLEALREFEAWTYEAAPTKKSKH